MVASVTTRKQLPLLETPQASEAGIRHMARMASGGIRLGAAAARDVYVEAQDLDRAREVLKVDEGFSEEELSRLSDEAGEAALDETP